MRAAVLSEAHAIAVEERPPPDPPAPDEVTIRVRAVGLCGSDVKYWIDGGVSTPISQPFVLGHEAAGEIVAVGSGVRYLSVGDRVAVEPGRPCGACSVCRRGDYNLCPEMFFLGSRGRDGALRELLNWPASLVFSLPPAISLVEGALVEPASVALAGIRRGGLKLGERALVLGAGAIGLVTVQLAKAAGATALVTDIEPSRLTLARSLSADEVILASADEATTPLPDGSVDLIIDTTGHAGAIRQAFPTLRPGGRLVLIGLGHDPLSLTTLDLVYRQATLLGVYRYADTFPTVIDLVRQRALALAPLVSHQIPLPRIAEALDLAAKPAAALKVVVTL